jgi:hypothetical protein
MLRRYRAWFCTVDAVMHSLSDFTSFAASSDITTWLIPLLAFVVCLVFLKKLIRLAIFLVIVAGVFLLLESQGIYVMDHIENALNELPLEDMVEWLRTGNR